MEFTLAPQPLLRAELSREQLRSGFIGDSHLVISEPLPEDEDRKHVITVKDSRGGVDFYIYCNAYGRLSHVNFKCDADCFDDALANAQLYVNPFLSSWATQFNTPLFVIRIRELESTTQISRNTLYHQMYPDVQITREQLEGTFWYPRDSRIFDYYREALNATNPKYQFICYFRVIELILGLRARHPATGSRCHP